MQVGQTARYLRSQSTYLRIKRVNHLAHLLQRFYRCPIRSLEDVNQVRSGKPACGGATHISFRLIVHQQDASLLVENAMEDFVQDHL